jgi:hypothetical protein
MRREDLFWLTVLEVPVHDQLTLLLWALARQYIMVAVHGTAHNTVLVDRRTGSKRERGGASDPQLPLGACSW